MSRPPVIPSSTTVEMANVFTHPLQGLAVVAQLGKMRLTSLVAVTAGLGFLMYEGGVTAAMFISTFGVFLLASGASALNQFQEYKIDANMNRTKRRPIVTGVIQPISALIISIVLMVFGAWVIFAMSGMTGLVLGLLAVVWYNGIYTYLKRVTALAVVPGSVIGALPPLIGWVAAGGSVTDPLILMTALFLMAWQLPHFWLLLMIYGRDYEKAGLPSLTERFTITQLKSLTVFWVFITCAIAILIPIVGEVRMFNLTIWSLVISAVAMLAISARVFRPGNNITLVKAIFHWINLYMVVVMLILCIDSLG